jgi:hypothetical protein
VFWFAVKSFIFSKTFASLAKLKLLKKKKTALGWWHSKQAANMLFCTSRGTQAALASKEVGRRPSP